MRDTKELHSQCIKSGSDGYNIKYLFILHVLGKCIITEYWANVSFLYTRQVPENKIEMNHWLKIT